MWFDRLAAWFLIALARLLTGAYANWQGCSPTETRQRLYFANHCSHLDFLLLWGMLPAPLRYRTRPVAGADYWNATPLRRYMIHRIFRGVLVERGTTQPSGNPLAPLQQALDAGDSLIFFPEGTRSLTGETGTFKSGLFHLARANPAVDFIPVYIENLSRVMPKGELLPVPLVCIVNFGQQLALPADESKADFLTRARLTLIELNTRKDA
jgi:1-acyl-sn-glycerol-3-phosphate acyltransferase